MVNVLIGIQARSNSTRFPGKVLEKVERLSLAEHVLYCAKSSASFINKTTPKSGKNATVVLLIPRGDIIGSTLKNEVIFEGSENDVLSRYFEASQKYYPDYVVRLTGDCPLMAPPLITKHINVAVDNALDYVTNTFEGLRTYIDGWDVEVISKRVLHWLHESAKSDHDREHVTTFLKSNLPDWCKVGVIMSHIDLSEFKYSVDFKEDLEKVVKLKKSMNKKLSEARSKFSVFRY